MDGLQPCDKCGSFDGVGPCDWCYIIICDGHMCVEWDGNIEMFLCEDCDEKWQAQHVPTQEELYANGCDMRWSEAQATEALPYLRRLR